jgi:hypothetical protein
MGGKIIGSRSAAIVGEDRREKEEDCPGRVSSILELKKFSKKGRILVRCNFIYQFGLETNHIKCTKVS